MFHLICKGVRTSLGLIPHFHPTQFAAYKSPARDLCNMQKELTWKLLFSITWWYYKLPSLNPWKPAARHVDAEFCFLCSSVVRKHKFGLHSPCHWWTYPVPDHQICFPSHHSFALIVRVRSESSPAGAWEVHLEQISVLIHAMPGQEQWMDTGCV